MNRTRASALSAFAILGLALPLFADDKPPRLVKEREIALEGGPFCDLMAVDPGAGRLYLAHSPNVDVLDLAKHERVGTVEGVERAHGVVVPPESRCGFATSGKANKLVVFDLDTLKTTRQIDTGENPDALLYVASTKEVWSFNGKAMNVTCVDATSLEVRATIALGGKPELAVEDVAQGHVYLNLEDQSTVGVIDAKTHALLGSHSLAPGEGPTGLALDARNGLLFVGCGNKKLVVVSTADWKGVASFDIGEHCDGVAFDPATGNVFASCRGATSVVHVKDAKTFEALDALDSPGGRTCALDPKTHRLYVSTSPPRGEAGAVKILVFAPAGGGTPSAPGAAPSAWTGKLEKLGPSIHMQGAYRLVLADGASVLLESARVDLAKFEGKAVTVSGRPSPTVEGHATLVDVESIQEAP